MSLAAKLVPINYLAPRDLTSLAAFVAVQQQIILWMKVVPLFACHTTIVTSTNGLW